MMCLPLAAMNCSHCGLHSRHTLFIIASAVWLVLAFKSVCERDWDWPLILPCSSTHGKWQTSLASLTVCLYNTIRFSWLASPLFSPPPLICVSSRKWSLHHPGYANRKQFVQWWNMCASPSVYICVKAEQRGPNRPCLPLSDTHQHADIHTLLDGLCSVNDE